MTVTGVVLLIAVAVGGGMLSSPIHSEETSGRERSAARPHAALAALPPNTAKDLGPYRCSDVRGEEAGRCRLITDFSGMVYDANRRRMVMFGGGHASTNYDSVNTFDLHTLRWVEEYPPTPCSSITSANFDGAKGSWRSGAAGPYPRAAARHTTDQLVVVGDELVVLAHVEGNGPCASLPKYTSYDFTSQSRVSHYNFVSRM